MNFIKLEKVLKEWKWALVLLCICIAGIPLTTIYGIQSVNWGNDFWPNALSEFLGMFVELIFGAVFTFVVIDKYIQYHKNKQWRRIKNITYKNLYFLLSNILLKLNLAFPKELRIESYILTEDIETLNDYLPKEDFDVFIDGLCKHIDNLIQEKHKAPIVTVDVTEHFVDENIFASLVKFKHHTKSDINSLSGVVIPKLLNFSDEQIVLDSVIELEELFTSLMSKINNVHKRHSAEDNDVKYIWLLKIQEILNKIRLISDSIKDDLSIE